jgi:hypothetical protein
MVKKVVLIVLGAILLLFGLLAAAGGGAILAAFGSDGEIRSGTHEIGTRANSLVSGVVEFSDLSDASDWVDLPTLMVDVSSSKELFIGVGPAADVDAYLADTSVAEVKDINFSPYRFDLVVRPGTGTPAAPKDQNFWVAQESGTDVSLRWDIQDGDYRLVLMNADGSAGVVTQGRLGIQVPFLGPIAIGLLVAGILSLIVGIVLLVLGLRVRAAPAAPPGPYQQQYPQPPYQPQYPQPPYQQPPPHPPSPGPPTQPPSPPSG